MSKESPLYDYLVDPLPLQAQTLSVSPHDEPLIRRARNFIPYEPTPGPHQDDPIGIYCSPYRGTAKVYLRSDVNSFLPVLLQLDGTVLTLRATDTEGHVKCIYCSAWGKPGTACPSCGAPI